MAAVHFSQDDFEKKVLKSDQPVLVDFYADWCGPCKMAAPVIDELADEYKSKAVVGKLDVDANRELAVKYGVMSIPTTIMFKDGKEMDRVTGFSGKEKFEDLIKKALGES